MRICLFFITLIFLACNVPKGFNSEVVITETLKTNCPDSYKYIKRHWKKHKTTNCYYVSERFITSGFSVLLDNCLTDIEMTEVEKVIGPPSSKVLARDSVNYRLDVYKYSLSPTGRCTSPRWEVMFFVSPSTNVVSSITKGFRNSSD